MSDSTGEVARWGQVELHRHHQRDGLLELELLDAKTSTYLTVRVGLSESWMTLPPPAFGDPQDTSNEVFYGVLVESCTAATADRLEAFLRQLRFSATPENIGQEGDGLHWCGEMSGGRLLLTDTREWATHRGSHQVYREPATGPAIDMEALPGGLKPPASG